MLQGFHVDGTIVLRNRAYDLAIQALGYRVCRFQDEAYLDADHHQYGSGNGPL